MRAMPPLADLLPHQAPMILLDSIVDFDAERILAKLCLREDSMFVRGESVRSILALEYVAQSVAAHAKLLSDNQEKPPQIGYVVSVPSMTLHASHFYVGDCLEVEAFKVSESPDLRSYRGTVRCQGDCIVEARLNIYCGEEIGVP